MPNRAAIPEADKRAVRQRWGFSCVVCGLPIYEYDHIEPYASTKNHNIDNLVLLCPNHHAEKTKGLLPPSVLRRAMAARRALPAHQTAAHQLHYGTRYARMRIGGNDVLVSGTSASGVIIDGHELVGFELDEGALLLNISLLDDGGSPVLQVERNELVLSTHLWDYTFNAKRLRITRASRDMFVEVRFEPANGLVEFTRGHLRHNGIEVYWNQAGVCILNNRCVLAGNTVSGFDAGIVLGARPPKLGPAAISIDVDRCADFDRAEALAYARRELKKTSPASRGDGGSLFAPMQSSLRKAAVARAALVLSFAPLTFERHWTCEESS